MLPNRVWRAEVYSRDSGRWSCRTLNFECDQNLFSKRSIYEFIGHFCAARRRARKQGHGKTLRGGIVGRFEDVRWPVSRVLSPPAEQVRGQGMAIHLGRPSPGASRDLPGRQPRKPGKRRPYLVLLPVGFTLPPPLPAARCALTAPFHPYPRSRRTGGAGGLLSVALSLGSPPPGVTRHRVPVEPGLSSPTPYRPRARPSGHLTRLLAKQCAGTGQGLLHWIVDKMRIMGEPRRWTVIPEAT